jgi:hypothetical protein
MEETVADHQGASGGAWLALGSAAIVTVAACVLATPDYSGRSCDDSSDCPEPYACVFGARPGSGRTCEVLYPPPYQDGGVEPLDGGPVYYCSEVKPLLDAYCTYCHGEESQLSPGMRLDIFDGGFDVKGAGQIAGRIKLRAYDREDMPVRYATVFPTKDERRILALWAVTGGQECDAGRRPDGG